MTHRVSPDHRRDAPATHRNRGPILAVLESLFRRLDLSSPRVLEVASGTGQHAAFFAARLGEVFPGLTWQPTDIDADALTSIADWSKDCPPETILPPMRLDAERDVWPFPPQSFDLVVNINMIHISPWTACQGLIRGAARVLGPKGRLYFYGPFRRGGVHTAESNAAFSRELEARDPAWGVRDLDDVAALAIDHGFRLESVSEMPANNLSVIFSRVEESKPKDGERELADLDHVQDL